MVTQFYVLVHAYYDKSAFNICGLTENREVADAWYHASEENDIYSMVLGNSADYCKGFPGWRSQQEKKVF